MQIRKGAYEVSKGQTNDETEMQSDDQKSEDK